MKKRQNLFLKAEFIAALLLSEAETHYGYYYKVGENLGAWLKRKKHRYCTTKAERERLAITSFTCFGSTFVSFDEVKKVAAIFKERYGSGAKNYNPKRCVKDIAAILKKEVRGKH